MQYLFKKISDFFFSSAPAINAPTNDHDASEIQSENGCRSMEAKHYNDAIEFYNKAIELDPADPFPYYAKAMAYEALGNYKDALRISEEAIKLDLDCAIAYNVKATALFALGRHEEALMAVDKAASLDASRREPRHLREKIVEAIKKNK